MLLYSAWVTIVGMGAVFFFLFLLMWTVQLMSYLIGKSDDDLSEIAAIVAVTLKKGANK
ncbi:MAG: OadG family protein [Alphaproteobacteria bacterium]|nr:OadG family protein [Alphaproteobacteria bacterium]